jgi:hypothetical protein
MRDRCNNPRSTHYRHYGGRGISCDPRWNDFSVFLQEMQDGYDDHLTLERLEVNGNYEKSNCTWVTRRDQVRNTRRALLYEWNGLTLPLAEIAEKVGINYSVLKRRLVNRGWTLDRAFNEPVYKGKLTVGQRKEIKRLLSLDPSLDKVRLADKYGVSSSLIRLIQKNDT